MADGEQSIVSCMGRFAQPNCQARQGVAADLAGTNALIG